MAIVVDVSSPSAAIATAGAAGTAIGKARIRQAAWEAEIQAQQEREREAARIRQLILANTLRMREIAAAGQLASGGGPRGRYSRSGGSPSSSQTMTAPSPRQSVVMQGQQPTTVRAPASPTSITPARIPSAAQIAKEAAPVLDYNQLQANANNLERRLRTVRAQQGKPYGPADESLVAAVRAGQQVDPEVIAAATGQIVDERAQERISKDDTLNEVQNLPATAMVEQFAPLTTPAKPDGEAWSENEKSSARKKLARINALASESGADGGYLMPLNKLSEIHRSLTDAGVPASLIGGLAKGIYERQKQETEPFAESVRKIGADLARYVKSAGKALPAAEVEREYSRLVRWYAGEMNIEPSVLQSKVAQSIAGAGENRIVRTRVADAAYVSARDIIALAAKRNLPIQTVVVRLGLSQEDADAIIELANRSAPAG